MSNPMVLYSPELDELVAYDGTYFLRYLEGYDDAYYADALAADIDWIFIGWFA